jgi:nitrate reductase NapAB chaperone NapD
MATLTFDFPALRTKSYTENYNKVPNRALPAKVRNMIKSALDLIGLEFNGDDHTVTVKANNGVFETIYTPTIWKGDGDKGAVIEWGDKEVPLTLILKHPNLDWTVSTENGQTILSIETKDSYELSEELKNIDSFDGLAFVLRMFLVEADETKRPSVNQLTRLLRDASKTGNTTELAKHLKQRQLLTYKMADLGIGQFKVVDYTENIGLYGKMYTMSCIYENDLDFTTCKGDTLKKGDTFRVFGASNVNNLLGLSPIINQDNPANLIISSIEEGKNGKTKVTATITCKFNKSEGDDDLDFTW